ncbi:uncharacterized protein LOC111362897 [Spodoptera litura]|uniref:Uncharacterized protein LOC111362897 n=1 Tax=Spodoptera litura TaxID=69820 RepID=A0A9J7EV25_SPOLT|nr:uncharacterized protein LOC111362897 [Spodoptera litura]
MYTALTFLSVIIGTPDQDLPNGCPANSYISVLRPHESDCSKFYICNNGNKIEMTCASGTLFDVNLGVCNLPFAVNCKNSTSNSNSTPSSTSTAVSTSTSASTANPLPLTGPKSCPVDSSGNSTLLPHETDCSHYYVCNNGQTLDMPCLPGKLFDYKLQMCVIAQLVTCYPGTSKGTPSASLPSAEIPTDLSSQECPKDSDTEYLLPHEDDCSRYYKCMYGGKIFMACDRGTLFDYNLKSCIYLATCYPGATTPAAYAGKMFIRRKS